MAQVWSRIADANGAPVQRSVQCVGLPADAFSAGANDGMSLVDVSAFELWAEADAGQTITTAVNAKGYAQDAYSARWGRAQGYDITGQTVTGVRTVFLGSFSVNAPCGRVAFENNGGAVSAGNLTFRIIATRVRDGSGGLA